MADLFLGKSVVTPALAGGLFYSNYTEAAATCSALLYS